MDKVKTLLKIDVPVAYDTDTPYITIAKLIPDSLNNALIKVQQKYELHQIVNHEYSAYNKAWRATLLVSKLKVK